MAAAKSYKFCGSRIGLLLLDELVVNLNVESLETLFWFGYNYLMTFRTVPVCNISACHFSVAASYYLICSFSFYFHICLSKHGNSIVEISVACHVLTSKR